MAFGKPDAGKPPVRFDEGRSVTVFGLVPLNPFAPPTLLNDVKDSDSIKTIIGRGRFKLTDTRPAERNGVNTPAKNFNFDPGNVVWTEYYGKETFIPAWITSC